MTCDYIIPSFALGWGCPGPCRTERGSWVVAVALICQEARSTERLAPRSLSSGISYLPRCPQTFYFTVEDTLIQGGRLHLPAGACRSSSFLRFLVGPCAAAFSYSASTISGRSRPSLVPFFAPFAGLNHWIHIESGTAPALTPQRAETTMARRKAGVRPLAGLALILLLAGAPGFRPWLAYFEGNHP